MSFVSHRMTAASIAALAAVTLIAIGLIGGQQEARAANASVSIAAFKYDPATLTVAVGDTVTWTNNEPLPASGTPIPHTVTSDTGTDLASPTFTSPQTYSKTFTAAGTYAYHCTVHPSMHGTVVVAAAGATTTATTTTTAVPTTPPPAATTAAAPTQPASAPINLTLSGANEVPPVNSPASGTFRGTPANDSLAFTVTASGAGFTQSHIHMGAAGTNGPIVAFLFGPVAAPGVSNFTNSGVITAVNLTGPLAGKTMADFNDAMRQGLLYVNAHSTANPGGEIRAQIPGSAAPAGTAPRPPATGSGTLESNNSAPLILLGGLAATLVSLTAGSTVLVWRRRR